MPPTNHYDVLVIGGGHAGAEAARAASAMGCRTCLLAMTPDAPARMSCNPAIGGLAKGQITREVDALGGLQALAIDAAGIQFRTLNASKGPAVQAPRAQADRDEYERVMARLLAAQPNLEIRKGTASEIIAEGGRVRGVRTEEGDEYAARAVIVTTGTFLNGLMHVGADRREGGRWDEPPARRLSDGLRALGLEVGRLKTGTPPRIARDSMDCSRLAIQLGDDLPRPFSYRTERIDRPQVPCHITFTNARTHEIIRENLDRAPLYTGQIASAGPRYCPSIETKIVRFAGKDRHQIFLEPEGMDSNIVYPNGISTSVPADVQDSFVRTIAGLEDAKILRYGYAVEYDYAPARQLHAWLETRKVGALFLAGQINGTSGYEEAAGLGLLAGINAALSVRGEPPWVPGRGDAYLGVMVDDLVTRDVREPYRMFTSRAEYRLLLRSDNADSRLMPIARRYGLLDAKTLESFDERQEAARRALEILKNTRDGNGATLETVLRRPGATFADLAAHTPALAGVARSAWEQIGIAVKYQGYVERQERDIDRFRRGESRPLPEDMDYARVACLRAEAAEALGRFRPASFGQAARLAGVTPADIAVLDVHLAAKSASAGRRKT
jgi:tRNA uridine 5-carboxymethylaminomethyl modification enzyme